MEAEPSQGRQDSLSSLCLHASGHGTLTPSPWKSHFGHTWTQPGSGPRETTASRETIGSLLPVDSPLPPAWREMLGLKEPMSGRKLSEVFLLGPNVPHHGNRIPKSQGSRNPHSINREAVQGHRQAGAEPELKAKVLGPSPTRFHNPAASLWLRLKPTDQPITL